MSDTIDDILARTRQISLELSTLDPEDPRRPALVEEQAALRQNARRLAEGSRHSVSVENEITMLEDRLEEIDGLQITKGYSQKHLTKTVQDPGAYSHNINRLLADEHADEASEIRARLEDLYRVLEEGPSS
jgi:hypothetical protein